MTLNRKIKKSHWKESTVSPSDFDRTLVTVKDRQGQRFVDHTRSMSREGKTGPTAKTDCAEFLPV